MTGDDTNLNIICPTGDEILSYKFTASSQCHVCSKVIKNPSAMRMHLAQTHGIGTENVLQSFNKAFNGSKKIAKSVYACPVFSCNRTYGTGRYFKALTTLREHYLCIHAEKKHVCQKCGAKFGNPKRIELHVKTCRTMFYCTCGSPFKRKDSLMEHSVKNHHELPADIRKSMLSKGSSKYPKGVNEPRNSNMPTTENERIASNGTSLNALPANGKVIGSESVGAGQQIKANAFLVISNSALREKVKDGSQQVSSPHANDSCHRRSLHEMDQDAGNTSEKTGAQIFVKDFDSSINLNSDTANSNGKKIFYEHVIVGRSQLMTKNPATANSIIASHAGTDQAGASDVTKVHVKESAGMDKNGEISPSFGLETSNCSNSMEVVPSGVSQSKDAAKLRRLNMALQQYKPIKKKNPLVPVVSDWQCIVPPRKYKKRRKRSEDRKTDRTSGSSPQEDTSLTSIQHCLKKASSFVKSLMPSIKSPRRVPSPDIASFSEPLADDEQNEQEMQEEVHTHEMVEKKRMQSLQRFSSSPLAGVQKHEQTSETTLKEGISQHSLAGLRDFIISSASSKDGQQVQNLSASYDAPEQATVGAQFSLEMLAPELLGFLRTSVEFTAHNKNVFTPPTNEVSTQETQTPIKVGSNQFSFDNGYPFLCHFDNNDIQTQTENFSSFLADAFTQTNQQSTKLIPHKQIGVAARSYNDRFENPVGWTNNNQTQTDSINQLIVDAFTQTRIGVDGYETAKAGTNSIADNHTQTNLSFDNFMKNFNFGTDDTTLDSNLMPDFTDMCTQTNPDPRFDSRFDELLAPLTSAHVQSSASNSSLNLSINSSQTQTVLSFDDMFGNSMGDDEVSMHDCRENHTTYTQTSIIDDIFQTDNFTQTQFTV